MSDITQTGLSEINGTMHQLIHVQRGDTWPVLAEEFKTTILHLHEVNRIKPPKDALHLGDTIYVPLVDGKAIF